MQKNCSKKHPIFEKWEHFDYWQTWPCKGYSVCKIITLGQKIKFSETYQKRIYKHIILVISKKILEKKPNIWEKRLFWLLTKMSCLCKIITLGQKINFLKTYQKRIYRHIILILCKKLLQKTPNIREIRLFWLLPKLASMQRL